MGVTAFSEQSIKTCDTPQGPVVDDVPTDPNDVQTLIGFLERPYPIATYEWTDKQAPGDVVGTLFFPYHLFKLRAIQNKLANFKFFRAGVKIAVRINGSKFHYGKLLIAYSPCALQTGDFYKYTDNIISCSGFPHVVMTPSENEVHEILLPFVSPYQFIDLENLNDKRYNIGVVETRVLNPLRKTTSANPVSVSIFASFVDVKLGGFSSLFLPTPMLPVIPKLNRQIEKFRIEAQGSEQIEKTKQGLISSTLEQVSSIAGSLKSVPFLGSIAGVTQGVTKGASIIARSMGFCKPPTLAATQPVLLRGTNLAYSKGLDTAVVLGLDPNNAIATNYDIIGSYKDEMSLDNIFSTPSLLTIEKYDPNSENKIWVFPVSPSYCLTEPTQGAHELNIYPTVLAFATLPFKYWRGSLRYCLQITCSAFHSGRLRVSWEPAYGSSSNPEEIANTLNRVVDIQQETQIYFTIPYMQSSPWMNINNLDHHVVDSKATTYDVNGKIVIDIINNFTHPESPIPPVYLNLWVSAGPDFQVARATTSQLRKYNLGKWVAPPPMRIEAQGQTRDELKQMTYDTLIPNSTGFVDDKILQGELVTHIKEITSRPGLVYLGTEAMTYPSFRDYNVNELNNTSFMDWFRMLFRFARGSVGYKAIYTVTGNNEQISLANFAYDSYKALIPNALTEEESNLALIEDSGAAYNLYPISTTLEAITPYYNLSYSNITSTLNDYSTCPGVSIIPINNGNGNPTFSLYSYTGDDYTLGFQIGPPMLHTGTSYVPPVPKAYCRPLSCIAVVTSGDVDPHPNVFKHTQPDGGNEDSGHLSVTSSYDAGGLPERSAITTHIGLAFSNSFKQDRVFRANLMVAHNAKYSSIDWQVSHVVLKTITDSGWYQNRPVTWTWIQINQEFKAGTYNFDIGNMVTTHISAGNPDSGGFLHVAAIVPIPAGEGDITFTPYQCFNFINDDGRVFGNYPNDDYGFRDAADKDHIFNIQGSYNVGARPAYYPYFHNVMIYSPVDAAQYVGNIGPLETNQKDLVDELHKDNVEGASVLAYNCKWTSYQEQTYLCRSVQKGSGNVVSPALMITHACIDSRHRAPT